MPEKVEMQNAKLYTQRGHRLFWLTKKDLRESTKPGDRYNVTITDGKVEVVFADDGSRKVYGKKTKDGMDPVIALQGKKITDAFGAAEDKTIDIIPMKLNGKGFVIGH